jgi:hypothetical protein
MLVLLLLFSWFLSSACSFLVLFLDFVVVALLLLSVNSGFRILVLLFCCYPVEDLGSVDLLFVSSGLSVVYLLSVSVSW